VLASVGSNWNYSKRAGPFHVLLALARELLQKGKAQYA
jgi:hypothetical protein